MGKDNCQKAAVCLDNFQPQKRISMLNLKRIWREYGKTKKSKEKMKNKKKTSLIFKNEKCSCWLKRRAPLMVSRNCYSYWGIDGRWLQISKKSYYWLKISWSCYSEEFYCIIWYYLIVLGYNFTVSK